MSKQSKNDQQVISDEADATVRESARQAALDKAEAQRVIDDAARAAAHEPTAPAAKSTFMQRIRAWLDSAER